MQHLDHLPCRLHSNSLVSINLLGKVNPPDPFAEGLREQAPQSALLIELGVTQISAAIHGDRFTQPFACNT